MGREVDDRAGHSHVWTVRRAAEPKERHLLTPNSPEPSSCPAPCSVHWYLAPDISAAHSLQAGDFHDSPFFQEECGQSQKTR